MPWLKVSLVLEDSPVKKQFLIGMVAAVAALSGGGAFAATNLVTDGNFSSPNLNGGWALYNSLDGWTSGNGDKIEVGGSGNYGLGCISANCQNLEVNANTYGNVYQTISGLTAGATYAISYLYGGRTSGGPSLLDVSFGGALLTTNSGSIGSWTSNVFNIVATSNQEILRFSSHASGNPSYGNEITNVSVTAVPGPVAGAGFPALLGLIGFGIYRRRRAIAA
jgi:hypothetical protein